MTALVQFILDVLPALLEGGDLVTEFGQLVDLLFFFFCGGGQFLLDDHLDALHTGQDVGQFFLVAIRTTLYDQVVIRVLPNGPD